MNYAIEVLTREVDRLKDPNMVGGNLISFKKERIKDLEEAIKVLK